MAVGAYGKMPGLGDFFRLSLPGDFVAAWDGWLQHAIPEARTELGAGWTAAYMRAPLWRFVLAPRLAGASAMLGVVAPSVDRVGRQFPLTLAVPLPGPVALAPALAANDALLAAMEDAALAALAQPMVAEVLDRRLALLPGPAAGLPGTASPLPGALAITARDGLAALANRARPGDGAGPATAPGTALFLAKGDDGAQAGAGGEDHRILAAALPRGVAAARFFAPESDPAVTP